MAATESSTAPTHEYKLGVQLDADALSSTDVGALERLLGPWANDEAAVGAYAASFASAEPFPHVVIDGFFRDDVARELARAFPSPGDGTWMRYENPIEVKLANNDLASMPAKLQEAVRLLNGVLFVALIGALTERVIAEPLEADPYLHGGGIHSYPRGGRLNVHLDYSVHPLSGKERRVNLIVYLSEGAEWDDGRGGGEGTLELWNDGERPTQRRAVQPRFNRAVLFQTGDVSYHGVPTPLQCAAGTCRNSLALYYVSDARADVTQRHKAVFFADADADAGMRELLRIRAQRRLTTDDVARLCPDWKSPMSAAAQ